MAGFEKKNQKFKGKLALKGEKCRNKAAGAQHHMVNLKVKQILL